MKPSALVTGASRGIGAAIAERLAEAGHEVILNYRSGHQAAEAVKARIEAVGGRARLLPFDVADAKAADEAIEGLLQATVPIGVIVNNAAVHDDAPFPSMEREAWESVTRTTLDGFYNVTRRLIMPMVARRWGRIINVASVAGIMGNRGQANYAAAKAGLVGATKTLAREVAKRGVTVNAVAPGLIDTDMMEGVQLEEALKLVPMRRMGQPSEVAKLVAFLASDDAGYITGQVIGINGGMV